MARVFLMAGPNASNCYTNVNFPAECAQAPLACSSNCQHHLTGFADGGCCPYRWTVVEEEVQEAAALGLPSLTPVVVQEQLFRAVLRCGHFNLVKKYLSGSKALPREVATAVVADVARDFLAAAKSLEAEEIGLGQVTLSLLPEEAQVQEQGRCLKALQELQDWRINMLPVQYFQVCGQDTHGIRSRLCRESLRSLSDLAPTGAWVCCWCLFPAQPSRLHLHAGGSGQPYDLVYSVIAEACVSAYGVTESSCPALV